MIEENNNIAFIICTNSGVWFGECKRFIERLNVPQGITVEIIPVFEAKGMANGYNLARKNSTARYKIYMHHDTFIINQNIIEDVINIFKHNPQIGIIGMVGANDIKNQRVTVGGWEYGKVLVCNGCHELLLDFGEVEEEYIPVDCVDGMFIATQYDIEWREDIFEGWHFYDRSICMEYKRKGYISVVPKQNIPWCIHDSGYNSLTGWENNLEIFVNEYHEYFSELCLENSDTEWIDESRKVVDDLESNIRTLINKKCIKEAIGALKEFFDTERFPSKELVFMKEIIELYSLKLQGKTALFLEEDDTVATMLEKYTRAKFILRRVIYGIGISAEEAAFINSLSEDEQKIIINHNLGVSMQLTAK